MHKVDEQGIGRAAILAPMQSYGPMDTARAVPGRAGPGATAEKHT